MNGAGIQVILQQHNNKALPFLISNATSKQVECREVEVRTERIIEGIKNLPFIFFEKQQADNNQLYGILQKVHSQEYLSYLDDTSQRLASGEYILQHPFVPEHVENDTPIVKGIFLQAYEAALTAVYSGFKIVKGSAIVYAVCRPPGHHAGRAWLGGYCYLNNAVIALQAIMDNGIKPVGLLDLDFHFGNGSADILMNVPDALFISIHSSTEHNYPYTNSSEGNERQLFISFTNKPSASRYRKALDIAVEKIKDFKCKALIVSIGFDIINGDPHGKWDLPVIIFREIGIQLGKLGIPLCLIQEGGYYLEKLGECAYQLCTGLNFK